MPHPPPKRERSRDTKSLYWAGTFVAPTAPGASYEWESKNDKSKTGGSVVGSPSDTKTFSFADGALSLDPPGWWVCRDGECSCDKEE
jgi:hypothetical protein